MLYLKENHPGTSQPHYSNLLNLSKGVTILDDYSTYYDILFMLQNNPMLTHMLTTVKDTIKARFQLPLHKISLDELDKLCLTLLDHNCGEVLKTSGVELKNMPLK